MAEGADELLPEPIDDDRSPAGGRNIAKTYDTGAVPGARSTAMRTGRVDGARRSQLHDHESGCASFIQTDHLGAGGGAKLPSHAKVTTQVRIGGLNPLTNNRLLPVAKV